MSPHPIPPAARRLSPVGAQSSSSVPSSAAGLGEEAQQQQQQPQLSLTYSAPPPAPAPTALPSQSLTTQLSDLLLSSVVPGISTSAAAPAANDDAPRKLSSRKEELNLTSTTGNFRKFVLKVGVVFWMQDRIEEVFTWRKPAWSVCFAVAWALISFYPHLLLMVPSVIALGVLLHPAETHDKVGVARPAANISAATTTTSPVRGTSATTAGGAVSDWDSRIRGSHGRSASVVGVVGPMEGAGRDSRAMRRESSHTESPSDKKAAGLPVTHGGSPESLSATYYSNIQGIQNLMGLFSDMHDLVTPPLTALISPSFPLHNPLIAANALALVGIALGGGWVPTWAVLLPLGWGPLAVGAVPLSFWSSAAALSPSPTLLRPLDKTYRKLLDDQIPPSVYAAPRVEVSVWETQRWGALEPANGGGEGWGKSRWEGREVGSSITGSGQTEVIALEGVHPSYPWDWLPHETWSVDHLGGTWIPSFARLSLDGWVYMDETHQVLPSGEDARAEGGLRRRRWWRRAFLAD